MVQEAGGVIGAFSSGMSLLADADESAWLYRVSKAALNMAVVSACRQWPGLTLLALDPGWVQTEMGGAAARCRWLKACRADAGPGAGQARRPWSAAAP
jgi:NAD(P)-dependent dehydrogenase (short-subunit alcohol dehydrogenase family)